MPRSAMALPSTYLQANATAQLLLNEEISRLTERVTQLKSERMSPISKLPTEILGTIFYLALSGRTGISPLPLLRLHSRFAMLEDWH